MAIKRRERAGPEGLMVEGQSEPIAGVEQARRLTPDSTLKNQKLERLAEKARLLDEKSTRIPGLDSENSDYDGKSTQKLRDLLDEKNKRIIRVSNPDSLDEDKKFARDLNESIHNPDGETRPGAFWSGLDAHIAGERLTGGDIESAEPQVAGAINLDRMGGRDSISGEAAAALHKSAHIPATEIGARAIGENPKVQAELVRAVGDKQDWMISELLSGDRDINRIEKIIGGIGRRVDEIVSNSKDSREALERMGVSDEGSKDKILKELGKATGDLSSAKITEGEVLAAAAKTSIELGGAKNNAGIGDVLEAADSVLKGKPGNAVEKTGSGDSRELADDEHKWDVAKSMMLNLSNGIRDGPDFFRTLEEIFWEDQDTRKAA
jgi:hypothetical protein